MYLVKFLNKLIKSDGFILIDSNNNKFVIGKPKKDNPIELKLLDKSLNYKLLLHPDLYFGEAYSDGSLIIKNGTLSEFLEIAMMNIGRGDINLYGKILNKVLGTYRYITKFNKIININVVLVLTLHVINSLI